MTRANYSKLRGEAVNALVAYDKAYADSTIGQTLIDLIRVRVSQINGCLFCVDAHSKEAKLHGERELRLYHLPLWRESVLFNEKEKAALEYAELLTTLSVHGVNDDDYLKLAAQFSEKEVVDLTLAISAINAWNRIGIGLRPVPGSLDKFKGLDKLGLE